MPTDRPTNNTADGLRRFMPTRRKQQQESSDQALLTIRNGNDKHGSGYWALPLKPALEYAIGYGALDRRLLTANYNIDAGLWGRVLTLQITGAILNSSLATREPTATMANPIGTREHTQLTFIAGVLNGQRCGA